MPSGLLALLDDVTALVKATAASLDDIPAQIAKAGSKVSGVVIDDAAVTPKYVVGLDPSRELTIIYRIARRSLINKMLFLGPAVLVLGYLAPWAITPLLMVGGAFLCFEGYEKLHAMLHPVTLEVVEKLENVETITPEALEAMRIKSAVQTDFILSAEIVAIIYGTVMHEDVLHQAIALYSVAIGITVAVYGFVAIVVKMDDIGLYLAKQQRVPLLRGPGRGVVKAMPLFLKILGTVGTFAMLWVGGEIVAHGVPPLHHALEALAEGLAHQPLLAWLAKAAICALGGAVLGALIAPIVARMHIA